MTQELQTLIEKARKMPPPEQFELLISLSRSLYRIRYPKLPAATADFKKSPSIHELIQNQETKPVTDIANLAADFWPEEESADDIIGYIYQQRREDRLKS
ncbi:MAG: hypothetical protein DRI57_10580 [Deltaproteobacteria bacterium]|nr:MAG: hypothetical protein DRI57_10580 [Deltaproteobacteria bacterium]